MDRTHEKWSGSTRRLQQSRLIQYVSAIDDRPVANRAGRESIMYFGAPSMSEPLLPSQRPTLHSKKRVAVPRLAWNACAENLQRFAIRIIPAYARAISTHAPLWLR